MLCSLCEPSPFPSTAPQEARLAAEQRLQAIVEANAVRAAALKQRGMLFGAVANAHTTRHTMHLPSTVGKPRGGATAGRRAAAAEACVRHQAVCQSQC